MTIEHQEYRSIIEQLASAHTNQRVSNGLTVHAAILLETMFKNASAEMRIFSRELNEVVYGTDSMLDAVRGFISKPYSSLKILLERELTEEALETHSLIKALKSVSGPHGSVEIIAASGNYSSGEVEHFAVMDNDGYRFEFDHDNTKAVANFNEPKVAKNLLKVFDQAVAFAKERGKSSLISFDVTASAQ